MDEQKVITNAKPRKVIKDSDSEWSLGSLQDINLKDINPKDLIDDQHDDNQPVKQSEQKVVFPTKPSINPTSPTVQVGTVHCYVAGVMIIDSINHSFIVDLDSWICDHNKQLVGFIMDVLGNVQHPYYVVKVINQSIQQTYPKGHKLFYLEGSKVLKEEDLSSIRSKHAIDNEVIDKQSDSDDGHSNRSQEKTNHFRRTQYSQQQRPQRSRTRENHRDKYRQKQHWNQQENLRNNQLNQAYLQGIYSAYYQQMMHLQNPNQYKPQ